MPTLLERLDAENEELAQGAARTSSSILLGLNQVVVPPWLNLSYRSGPSGVLQYRSRINGPTTSTPYIAIRSAAVAAIPGINTTTRYTHVLDMETLWQNWVLKDLNTVAPYQVYLWAPSGWRVVLDVIEL